jgi:hypothetical protein
MPLELLIGAAVGAGLASTPVRKVLRKGVVYSLAGALVAYDKVSGLAANIRSSRHETAGTETCKKNAPEATTTAGESPPCAGPAAPAEPANTH